MNTKNYCVYSHTNQLNGKIYIGLTGMKPEERWKNGKGYRDGAHFRNAIDKYGWNNFTHVILKDNLTEEEAVYWEEYYINLYNACDRQYGYNMTFGGEHGGHPQTEETRQKIRKHGVGFRGRKHTEEAKRKMSKSSSGVNHPNYGKHLSETTRQKISDAHKLLRNRRVYCYELNCVFESLDEASETTGCWKSSIVRCCQGKQKQSKGYHFKYID